MDCPICKGKGRLDTRLCPACNGTGQVTKIKKKGNETKELGKINGQKE